MSATGPGGQLPDFMAFDAGVTLEELRDRNPNAVAMDVLYLLTTGFFTHLSMRGFWPAVIAAVPLVTFLYFGFRSSGAFFTTQVLVVVATVAATMAGLIPL